MSLSSVLAYPRARMKELGFVEHDDAEDGDNVPRTNLDTAFHLVLDSFSRDGENQDNMEMDVPFILKVYRGIRRDTNASRDALIVTIDTIIDAFVLASNRLTASGIKTVIFDRGKIEQLSSDNDNAFMATLEFTALVIKSTR